MNIYPTETKFLTYFPEKHSVGGIGHCFIDYLSALIISEIFEEVTFINYKFEIPPNNERNMIVHNKKVDWFNFLNLHELSKNICKKYFKRTRIYSS